MPLKDRTRFLSKDGVFCVSPTGKIIHWGMAAEGLLGYPAEEAIGKYCFDLLGRGNNYGFPCSPKCHVLNNVKQSRSSKGFNTVWRCKSGASVGVNVSTVTRESEESGKEVLHVFWEDTIEGKITGMAARAASMEEPHNRIKLTPRESQTLRLIAAGFSTTEIASQLGIARLTARNHITYAMDKLGVSNRAHAVVKALAGKLI